MTHRNPKWPDACASRDPGPNWVRRDSERESAPREERKVVSVFFADLVDFTATAEQLDPEDTRGFLMPYWANSKLAAAAAMLRTLASVELIGPASSVSANPAERIQPPELPPAGEPDSV